MKTTALIIHRALAPYRVDLFNALADAYDCHIYFEYDTAREQVFCQDELQTRCRFSYKILPPGIFGRANLRTTVFDLVRRHRPQLILCSEFNIVTALLIAAKALFAPTARLHVLCDDNDAIARSQAASVNAKQFLMRAVDGIICLDRRASDLYTERYARGARFHYLPMLQEESFLRREAEALITQARSLREHYAPNGPLLLFVGRLAPEKNLAALFHAVELLSDASVRLLIVGDGPLKSSLVNLAAGRTVPQRIHFAGKQEGKNLLPYYLAADLLVLPSIIERFGAVANEALIMGLPVLCSDVAGMSCLINERIGGIFSPFSSDDLLWSLTAAIKRFGRTEAPKTLPASLMPMSFADSIKSVLAFFDNSLCAY